MLLPPSSLCSGPIAGWGLTGGTGWRGWVRAQHGVGTAGYSRAAGLRGAMCVGDPTLLSLEISYATTSLGSSCAPQHPSFPKRSHIS